MNADALLQWRKGRGERRLIILLQGLHGVAVSLERGDAERGGLGAGEGGHDGRVGIDGGGADADLVRARGLAGRRVDDELDLTVLEQIERVGPAFGELEDALHLEAGL